MAHSSLRALSVLSLASLLPLFACTRGADSTSTATTSGLVSGSAKGAASGSGAASFVPSMSSAAVRDRAVAACNDPKAIDRRGPCKTACEMGNGAACETIAELLRAMPVDPNGIPAGWYGYLSAACDLGRAGACQKREIEFKKLREGCTKETPKGCVAFDQVVEQGTIKEPVHVAIDEALGLGCDGKDADACARRGLHLVAWPPLNVHRAMAAKAYERACELGTAAYCCAASKRFASDPNMPHDAAKAAALYKKGLAAGAGDCVDPASLPPAPTAATA